MYASIIEKSVSCAVVSRNWFQTIPETNLATSKDVTTKRRESC